MASPDPRAADGMGWPATIVCAVVLLVLWLLVLHFAAAIAMRYGASWEDVATFLMCFVAVDRAWPKPPSSLPDEGRG